MMTPDEILRQADEQIASRKSANKPATASGAQSDDGWRDPWSEAPTPRGLPPSNRTDEQAQQPSSDGFGARLKQGVGRAFDSAQVALSGDEGVIAKVAADQQRNALPQTALQRQMAEEIAPYNEAAKNAEGFADSARAWGALGLKRAGQLLSNPAEAGKMIVEQLPNSIPGLAGGFAGAKAGAAAGTALGGPVGTVIGGIGGGLIGGFAGGYGLEKGASVIEQVQEKAHQQGVDLQDQVAARGFVAKNLDEIDAAATRKAVGTAGTDAALNVLTMGAAGLSGRGIVNEARALAKAVDDGVVSAADATAALARLEAANAARNTVGQKALRGGAVVGAEMAGEGVSEAVGQKYAYGEVDPGQVIDEALLGLGQGGAMALGGKAFRKAAGLPDNDDAATRSLDGVHSALAKNAGLQQDGAPNDGDSGGGGVDAQAGNPAFDSTNAPAPFINQGVMDANGLGPRPPAPVLDTQRLDALLKPQRPSEAMGLRTGPDAGPLENAAALSVDTGATAQMQGAAGIVANDLQSEPQAANAMQAVNLDAVADPYERAMLQRLYDDHFADGDLESVISANAEPDTSFDFGANVNQLLANAGATPQEIEDAQRGQASAQATDRPGQAQENDRGDFDAELSVAKNEGDGSGRLAGAEQGEASQQPLDQQAAAPGSQAEGANVATLAQLNRKKLAEMTDDELQQLSSLLPADHSRQQKIQKAIQTRAAQAQAAINQGVKTDGTQADQTQQAIAQPTQAGAAQAGQQTGQGLNNGATPAENDGRQASAPTAPQAQAQELDRQQRAQRIADAGAQWTRMPAVQRSALAQRLDGVKPVLAKNLPRAKWDDLHIDIQRKLADAMGTTPARDSSANNPENKFQSAPEWWTGRSEDERRLLISVTNRLSGNAFANATTEWDSLSSEQKTFLAKEYDKYVSGDASVGSKAIAKVIVKNGGKSSAPRPNQPPTQAQQAPAATNQPPANLQEGDAAQPQKLPPTDIRIGDKVMVDGEAYTVTGPLKEGKKSVGVVASRDSDTNPLAGVRQVFLRGDAAIVARIAAQKEQAATETAAPTAQQQTDAQGNDAESVASQALDATESVTPEAGPFGPIFDGFENDPEGAIAKLMQEKRGEVPDAFTHPELGSIAFIYGDEGMGLRHIEAKRGIQWVHRIPAILRNGRLERDPKLPRAYLVQDGGPAGVAVIRLDWDGEQKTWLVTAHPDDKGKWSGVGKTSRTADNESGLVQGNPSQSSPQGDSATTSKAKQPITRADVEAAQQQAAASIGARIDAMSAGDVNKIAKKFLPTMGMKPTMSKANNKAAMTDAKINLMAAAAEVGAVLPAEVTRALQADMEGRVVDVAQDDGITKPAAQSKQAQEATKPEASAATDFIPAPDGGLDYGEITPEMGKTMRRQAGKIRLRQGNEAWGLTHIENRHGKDFAALGFKSARDFVSQVASGFTKIYKGRGAALDVVLDEQARGMLIVSLEPSVDGDFYDIKTATPIRRDQFKNETPLWERAGPSASTAVKGSSPYPKGQSGSASVQPAPVVAKAAKPAAIEDFGEKLEGARKDLPPSLKEEVSDAQMASLPLSKIWPSNAHEEIQNDAAAALAFAARQEIPAKPRQSVKVQRWVQKVKNFRALVTSDDALAGNLDKLGLDGLSQRVVAGSVLEGFFAKVRLLAQLPRDTWGRVEKVREYPDAVRYGEDGQKAPIPFSAVVIDGEAHQFDGAKSIGPDEVNKIKELLGAAAPKKGGLTAADFEIRTYKNRAESFINRKGDKEMRPLKTFTGQESGKQAREWLKANVAQAEAQWEAVKARDNVGKSDVRTAQNRQRVGADHRKGADVTAQMFEDAFGFRGVQFGNWVAQGAGAKDRQGLLNEAYDALMDLSLLLGVPSRAMSLDGSLGLSLGARGSGKAAAHFEHDSLVINLTKTKGAGSLAHEWFHALDNYFRRQRGGMDKQAGREDAYITYKPEAAWVPKAGTRRAAAPLTSGQLRQWLQARGMYDSGKSLEENAQAANFERDPQHKDGVRPQVEAAFAQLVQALNDSPMAARATVLDGGAAKGYWGRIIERGARSFENYVINKMALQGYSNDFLANIRSFDEWQALGKNAERYPYLTPAEEGPVVEAFDNLFETIETRQGDDGNVGLYYAANPARRPGTAQDKAVMQAIADGKSARDVLRLIANDSKDPFLRQVARLLLKAGITPNIQFGHIGKTAKGDPIHGQYRGKSDTIAIAGSAEYAAERIFMHEAMHAATMRALKNPGLVKLQLQKLLEHVRKQGGADGFYGLKNLDEFVVEVFTNPDFQNALRGMSAPTGSPLKSAWHSFVQVLRRILGLGDNSTSVLSQALELGVAAVRQDMVLRRRGEQAPNAGRALMHSERQIEAVTLKLAGWTGSQGQLRDLAGAWYNENLRGKSLPNDDMGVQVQFSSEGRNAAFATSGNLRAGWRAEMVKALPDLIQRAVKVAQALPDERKAHKTRMMHTLVAPLAVNGKIYAAKITLREALQDPNGVPHKFYDVTALEIENGPEMFGVAPGVATGPVHPTGTEPLRVSVAELAKASTGKYPGTTDFDTIAKSVLPSNARSDTGDVRIVYPDGQDGQDGVANFGVDDVQRNISNGIKAVTAMDVKQLGRHKLTDWLRLGLQFLGRRQLVDVYGDLIPQMRDYDRLAAQMEADKNTSGADADELVRRWAKLPDEGKLADLMHDATLAQIDADSDVAAAADDDRAQATTLKARFKALSPEAQAVYRESRDGYKAHHEKVRKAIRERIERSELSSEKRHELLTRMDDDFFQKVKGVYFPLARFGRYVAVVKDGAGQVVSVSRAETMPEAESARAALLKAFPTAQGFTVGRVTSEAGDQATEVGMTTVPPYELARLHQGPCQFQVRVFCFYLSRTDRRRYAPFLYISLSRSVRS